METTDSDAAATPDMNDDIRFKRAVQLASTVICHTLFSRNTSATVGEAKDALVVLFGQDVTNAAIDSIVKHDAP